MPSANALSRKRHHLPDGRPLVDAVGFRPFLQRIHQVNTFSKPALLTVNGMDLQHFLSEEPKGQELMGKVESFQCLVHEEEQLLMALDPEHSCLRILCFESFSICVCNTGSLCLLWL